MGFFARVDAVVLKQFARVWRIGHTGQQERHQTDLVRARYFFKQAGKAVGIVGAVIGWHLHAHQQHAGTGFFGRQRHLMQVVFTHGQRQAAQSVVAAQLDDDVAWPVLRQQRAQARAAAGGGVAADAGVDHPCVQAFRTEFLFQQGNPAGAPAQAILGTQRVTQNQNDRFGCLGPRWPLGLGCSYRLRRALGQRASSIRPHS